MTKGTQFGPFCVRRRFGAREAFLATLACCALLRDAAAQAPPSADEPAFTISAVRTYEGYSRERTETTREFELCDTWSRGIFGAGGPRQLYHRRGSLLALKPGEVLLFRERSASGHGVSTEHGGSSLNVTMSFVPGKGERVSAGGEDIHNIGPDQADALFRRTEHGAVIEFDCSVASLTAEDAFGMLGDCVPDEPGWQNLSRFELTDDDLRKWGTVDKTVRHSGPSPAEKGATESYEARLSVTPGGKEVEVALEGCAELGVDQQSTVTAKGNPAGGSYHFRADSPEILRVQGQGSTAKVSGIAPGKTTLHVEYTGPGGKSAQASQPAAAVRVQSVNNGQPVPKIGLYDETGKRTSAIRTVPVSVQPQDAADSLSYGVADPAVLSVMNQGDRITLQGVQVGITTFQASTGCSGPFGPVTTVQVVRCDDEVLAKLAEEERITKDEIRREAAELSRIHGQIESVQIADATLDLAVNTGGLIVGTLAAGGGKAVETAANIYGHGSNLRDLMNAGDWQSAATATAYEAVQIVGQALESALVGAVAGGYQTIDSANTFGKALGKLKGGADELQNANRWYEHWLKALEDVERRKKICRGEGEQPPQQKDQTAKKGSAQPKRNPPAKTGAPTAPAEPTAGEPPAQKQPADQPPQPPPSPASPPRQVGLPYEPGECGCKQTRSVGADSAGIGLLSAGMQNLKGCVEQFRDGTLTKYMETLDGWATLYTEVESAAAASPAERKSRLEKISPTLDSLLKGTEEFEKSGGAFYENFKSCPDAIGAGVGVLRSASTTEGR